MRYRRIVLLAICLMGIGSCSIGRSPGMDDFQRRIAEAESATMADNLEQAKAAYHAADEIAQQMKWPSGTVTARQALGDLAVIEKDYQRAEESFLSAKDVCLSNRCVGLDVVYDRIMLFYLFQGTDIDKAEALADEVSMNWRLMGGDRKELVQKLFEYAGQMRQAGFRTQGEKLQQRAQSL